MDPTAALQPQFFVALLMPPRYRPAIPSEGGKHRLQVPHGEGKVASG